MDLAVLDTPQQRHSVRLRQGATTWFCEHKRMENHASASVGGTRARHGLILRVYVSIESGFETIV